MATPSMGPQPPQGTLSIQDYLDASSDATKRSRLVLLTMVVASVLTAIGVLNSLQNSWMQGRIIAYQNPHGDYAMSLLGNPSPPPTATQNEKDLYTALYKDRYTQLFAAAARGYVATNSVHIPFFGINFDINDLGMIAGLAFAIILIWFRLCIRVEIENLNLSFAESRKLKQLPELYRLLAMRQVMTSPRVPGRVVHKFYLIAPKALCIMPAAIYVVLTIHDYVTRYVGADLHMTIHTYIVLTLEVLFSVWILWLTFQAWRRWRRLDYAWTWYWCEYLLLTAPTRREIGTVNDNVPAAERLKKELTEPLKELAGTPLEGVVLSQLDRVDKENPRTYSYASGNVVLSLEPDLGGKLGSWEVT